MIEFALARFGNFVGELFFDFVIKNRVLAEPDFHALVDLRGGKSLFFEPE